MRKLFAPVLLLTLLLSGCIEKERYTDASSGRDSRLAGTSDHLVIHSHFPKTPMIAQGGMVHLSVTVTDGAGNLLESSPNDPVTVSYSSSDPQIVRVNDRGNLYGERLGMAEITVQAIRGDRLSRPITVFATVTERNAIDVAELFFAPMQAYIDIYDERTFRLSAVDYHGTATSLSEGQITFELSNDNIVLTSDQHFLAPNGGPVEVKIRGLRKGFSFVTPIYELRSRSGEQTVRITGTPLVVQVKDSVETSAPVSAVNAGRYLSIGVHELNGQKELKIIHHNHAHNELFYSHFYGSWRHSLSAVAPNTGQGAAMALSPFDRTRNLPMVLALQDQKAVLWYQANTNGSWDRTVISTDSVVDEIHTYPERQRLMDITTFRSETNSSQTRVHLAYYDALESRVCLSSMQSPTVMAASTHVCMVTAAPVSALSVAANHTTGEPRLIYATSERIVTTEINASEEDGEPQMSQTIIPAELYYVSRQDGQLFRERIAGSDLITNQAGLATLQLDRNNKPIVALKDGRHVRLFYREYVPESDSYSWQILPVDGLDPIPEEIRSLDFDLDEHNEPRLSFATLREGEQKIRYARRPPFRGLGSRWVVETPGQMRNGKQGDYNAIAVDSSGRAHLVYSLDDEGWFNYWAEPNFFDYRNYPATGYNRGDVIGPGGALPQGGLR